MQRARQIAGASNAARDRARATVAVIGTPTGTGTVDFTDANNSGLIGALGGI